MLLRFLVPLVAAFVAGAINAVGGGGSFFTVPSLIGVGIEGRLASATSTVAIWPGSVASIGAYRQELKSQGPLVKLLAGISLIGGLLGALLLWKTPSSIFNKLLPYLLLAATLIFMFSPRINAWVRRDRPAGELHGGMSKAWIIGLQLVISVYGGFFGGGIGILMLATLGLMGMTNIHEMNAVKTVLATLINGIAVVTFVVVGLVVWNQVIVMSIGALIGGYGGAAFARRIKPLYVRNFVILTGFAMSLYLFTKY